MLCWISVGLERRRCAIAAIASNLGAALAQPLAGALDLARQYSVAHIVDEVLRVALETGAFTCNTDGDY